MGLIPVSKFRVEIMPEHFSKPEDIHMISSYVTFDGCDNEVLVVNIIRNHNDSWSVGNSMCLPTGIMYANDTRIAINKAFKVMKRINKKILSGKEYIHESF